ncbi:EAL domain-containing protein [Microvirga sp. TS319]|uniref:EAL domain-containing protein n=1 Tax=Microvirga sp. TS319 TaxID=3241165 RepID=UPI00351A8B64
MLFQDRTDTEINFQILERKISEIHSHLGGIPARELGCALQSGNGLAVVYQPQINVSDDQISAVEALVRWHHPRVGDVPPRVFIPIAEETGQILQITDFVLREACFLAKRHPELTVAVNLSPTLFTRPILIERIVRIVANCRTLPRQIEFEITEDQPLAGDGSARRSIAFLRESGFRIALDDFGTGYSGLKRLNDIAVDKIKIDQSFVAGLSCESQGSAQKAIKEMIEVGRAMNLTVTAEGIETKEQREFLASVGCDVLQGFFFARPMSAQALEEFLQRRPWSTPCGRSLMPFPIQQNRNGRSN